MPRIDPEKVRQAARNNVPLTIKTYTLPHETEEYLEEILAVFLQELGQDKLKDGISYCLRELAVNAKKANIKRAMFDEKGLSLDDPVQYQQGMETFKTEMLENQPHWMAKLKEKDFYTKVVFHIKGNELNLYVLNNVLITRAEQMRVHDRIARSRQFNSLEEALTQVLDDSEGAGLGIVILVLMLKKIGLDEEAFELDTRDKSGETVARIRLPMNEVRLESLEQVSKEITDRIDELPQFPENVTMLQKMLNDPDVQMADIARRISTDPALTADLLKLVNSAAYLTARGKVDNIVQAVNLVGTRGLKNLLYRYGTEKVLGEETPETRQLWEHSSRTAFYAFSFARSVSKNTRILDDVYVGGILHDMGKIIFAAAQPELIDRINAFARNKGITTQLFEDLAKGLNHAEIGGLIAEKWNFPEPLIEAIRYHHDATSCSDEHRDVVYTVYLANSMANIQEGLIGPESLDPQVLSYLDMDLERLKYVMDRLSQAYERELART